MSIQPRSTAERTLRATLCEIEPGMFYATYPDGEDALPVYQAGRSDADARKRIERGAFALGYDSVSWTAANVAPLFPRDIEPAALLPNVLHAPRARA